MPDLEISNLTVLPEGSVAATDPLPIVDVSASETKKVTVKDLIEAGVALIDSASIPSAKIGTLGTNQVATAAIQDLAITTAKIANGAITVTQITDATITGAKLVNDTITATQIAANAISASELADNSVDTNAITNNAITNVKINNGEIVYAKLNISDGDIPGAKITGNSITSAQIGTNAIGASELADNSVDTAAIIDAAITGAKIAADTIGSGNIAANAVGASELADNAVDTSAIASSSITTVKIAGNQVTAEKLADNLPGTILATGAIGSTQIAANAITASELANNAVDADAIAGNAVTEVKIASSAVTNAKIADNTITPAKLNTSNLDRSINVASGNLGINNAITAATRSGITYNAQGLITGTVALAAADLPVATTSAVGGVSVGTGLSVTGAGALSLSNSITGATISGITFNAQGMITAATSLTASDLPTATTSAKGAVQITSGGGLTVDGSGNLSTSTSGISAGTYQSITVNNKGVATAGAALTEGLIPSLPASKITSGSLDAARIGASTISGAKLADSSVCQFTGATSTSGIVTFPTAEYKGQFFYDLTNDDLYVYDGSAFQPVTITSGEIIYSGNYRADTNKITSLSAAGTAQGFTVGSALAAASEANNRYYFVCDKSGTGTSPAPTVSINPPDMILSNGTAWEKLDISNFIAGQVASNIGVTASGGIQNTNVQSALEELDTEKLAKTGGEITGQLLIGNAGSLVFEGATADAFETTLAVVDPTTSDKTITFPDTTGTVITTGDTGTVTSAMLANGTIVNADINASAAIALTKLANVTAAQIIVGNGSNVPTAVAVTGDIGITNAGLTSISAGVIVNADVSSTAAIAGSKITTGTTSAVGVLQLTDSATSTSTSTAATPAAVKVAKDAADAAQTTANAALPTTGGTLTGNLILDNAKELRLSEADGDGANYTGLKAQAQSGDITLTLPAVAPTAGQVLRANASTPTTLEWGTDTATDATKMPLAGGTFTGDVTFTGDAGNVVFDKSDSALEFADNAKLKLGTGGDLEIFHNGYNSKIADVGTGALILSGSVVKIENGASSETQAVFTENGAVELYYDNSKKFETTSTGITVSGTVKPSAGNLSLMDSSAGGNGRATFGGGDDLQIWHDGTHSYLENTTGDLKITDTSAMILSTNSLRIKNGASDENYIVADVNSDVALYYDNSKKFETTSTGVSCPGILQMGTSSSYIDLPDNASLYCGTGDDLRIFHNGTNSEIDNNTGVLYLESDGTWITDKEGSDKMAKFLHDGAVELYYDNVKKFETNSTGTKTTGGHIMTNGGTVTGGDLSFADSSKAKFGDGNDLQLYHNGSHSYIKNDTGNLHIASDGFTAIYGGQDYGEYCAVFTNDGQVDLYYDNSKKLNTYSGGVEVTGLKVLDNNKLKIGNAEDLQIYHDGSHSFIANTTGQLNLRCNTTVHLSDDAGYDHLKGTKDGSVEIYYDGSKKFETASHGVSVQGQVYVTHDGTTPAFSLSDSGISAWGSSNDLQIYHNGSNSYLFNSTGELIIRDDSRVRLRTDSLIVNSGDNTEGIIYAVKNGTVELYYDNSKKLETQSWGTSFTGNVSPSADNQYDLGASAAQWNDLYIGNNIYLPDAGEVRLGNSGDLQLYHDGSNSYINDTGTGDLTIVSNTIRFKNSANTEHLAIFDQNNYCALYYDDNKKFETTANGASITGRLDLSDNLDMPDNSKIILGTGDDLQIYSDGSTCFLKSDDLRLRSAGNENYLTFAADGAATLFYDGVNKFETTSTGAKVTGDLGVDCNPSSISSSWTKGIRVNTNGGSPGGFLGHSTGSYYTTFKGDANRSAGDLFLAAFQGYWNGNRVAEIVTKSGSDTTNKDDGYIVFRTTESGGSITDRVTIATDGKVGIGTANPDQALHITAATPAIRLENTDTSLEANQLIGKLEFEKQDPSGAGVGVVGGLKMYSGDSIGSSTYLTLHTSSSATNELEALRLDSSQNATFAGTVTATTVSDSKGNLRSIPSNYQSSAYTLVASDAGKHVTTSGNTLTIPNNIFSSGDAVTIVNNSSSEITITASIANLFLGSDGSTGNKKLAGRCTATVLFTGGTHGYISGGGLTAA